MNEEDAGQSMVVAVATGCARDCDRVAVPTEDNGRRRKRLQISQATTVAIPPESFVDLTQRDVSGATVDFSGSQARQYKALCRTVDHVWC